MRSAIETDNKHNARQWMEMEISDNNRRNAIISFRSATEAATPAAVAASEKPSGARSGASDAHS